jgi:hypothetical protein
MLTGMESALRPAALAFALPSRHVWQHLAWWLCQALTLVTAPLWLGALGLSAAMFGDGPGFWSVAAYTLLLFWPLAPLAAALYSRGLLDAGRYGRALLLGLLPLLPPLGFWLWVQI